MEAIIDGARTVIDLTIETAFRPQEIDDIVKVLESERRVTTERMSIHGTGRPSKIIKPIRVDFEEI
jgi:hypothetical protein